MTLPCPQCLEPTQEFTGERELKMRTKHGWLVQVVTDYGLSAREIVGFSGCVPCGKVLILYRREVA